MAPSALLPALLSVMGASGAMAGKKDVIMIAVDDMRPELNCYGKSSLRQAASSLPPFRLLLRTRS